MLSNPFIRVAILSLVLTWKPLATRGQAVASSSSPIRSASASPSAVVTFTIEGENSITLDSRVWDFPVSLYESAYFDVAALLNSLAPGTPKPTTPSTTANKTNTTSSTETPAPEEEGMKLWVILLISGGGLIVVVGVAAGIWFGVKNQQAVHPAPPDTSKPSAAFRMMYPPPHAYSKVIQIPLTMNRIHPDFHPMYNGFSVQ